MFCFVFYLQAHTLLGLMDEAPQEMTSQNVNQSQGQESSEATGQNQSQSEQIVSSEPV